MTIWPRATQLVLLVCLLLFSSQVNAMAHTEIDVGDGRYVMEIGFRDEPAYLGQPNALWLKVEEFATGGTQPVDGLAATLTAEVAKDGQTMTLPLIPMGDGVYEGLFVPTAVGDYTFRVFGTIGDAEVDESVSSSPTTFNAVEPLSSIEFPVKTPDPAQIAADAAAANAAAESTRMLAIGGLVAGVLGLVVGGIALARAGRVKTDSEATPIAPTSKLIR